MASSEPKTWKSGIADETWKVMVCAQQAKMVDDVLTGLTYWLTDCGSNYEIGLKEISQMTGAQIVEGLLAAKRSDYLSIQRALQRDAA